MEKKNNTLYSEKVKGNNKMYYLDLRKAGNGSDYLVITQSKKVEGKEEYERSRMILFENEVEQFGAALSRILINFTKKNGPGISSERVEKVRAKYPNAFHPWSKEDEELLATLFNEGQSMEELSKALQRNLGGIQVRLKKLGLVESQKMQTA